MRAGSVCRGCVHRAPGPIRDRPTVPPAIWQFRVAVRAENVIKGEVTHTNTAYFVYVALGDDGRPTPVPSLLCETEAQKLRFARAEERRAFRLQQSHHDKT